MKEAISDNCQALIKFISSGEFHNLAYASFVFIGFFIAVFLIKTISVFQKSKSFADKLSSSSESPEKLKLLLEKLNLKNQTRIFKSERLMAFCYGVRAPKIYLSSSIADLSNEKELEAVLRHEQFHLLNKDTLVMFWIHILKSVFGFLPGFTVLAQNIHAQREIKADSYAVKFLGDKRPLLSVIKKILEEPNGSFVFVPNIVSYDTLEPRIYALTKENFKHKRITMAQLSFSILILLFLWIAVMIPVYAHEMHNESSDMRLLCPKNAEGQSASYPYTPVINL